jgi:hypothetical protein
MVLHRPQAEPGYGRPGFGEAWLSASEFLPTYLREIAYTNSPQAIVDDTVRTWFQRVH